MFWRRRKRLEEEIETHIAAETAENMARGMDAASARFAALRAFGSIGAAKERARELDPLYWLDTLWQDVQFAFRLILRNPWSSATLVATLTLGIALNVTVFTVLNALLLRPWVSTDPETFITLVPRYAGEYSLRYSDYGSMSQPDYELYRDSTKSIESLAAYRMVSVTLGGTEAGTIRAGLITCNLFDAVKLRAPLVGRYFAAEECSRSAMAQVAILSEPAWRARFNADPDVIGRLIQVNRISLTVVGVAPALTLGGPANAADIWVPYTLLGSFRPADEYFADARAHWLTVIGRRRPDASMQQVSQELARVGGQADARVPGRETSIVLTDGSLIQDPEMHARAPLIFAAAQGVPGLLLALACVNVATLLLSRSAARRHEISVRLSLGAGRSRLIRQLLTESLVLSGIAAAFSFVIAQRAPAALLTSLTGSPPGFPLPADWRVFIFSAGVALATGIGAGVSPALDSLRPQIAQTLRGSGGAMTPGQRSRWLRNSLIAVQISLSLVLLAQAALFLQAQRRFFVGHDPGFETRQVIRLTLASVQSGFAPPASFYQELEARVRGVAGVRETAFASLSPWSGRSSSEITEIDGAPVARTRDFRKDPARREVAPGYFAALSIPITRGRGFQSDEGGVKGGRLIPTVISESMARRYWPGQDAVGRRFRTASVHEVIGVCRDVQSISYMQPDGPFFYSALDPSKAKPPYLFVRVAGETESASSAIREVVRQLDPQMAVGVETLASMLESQGRRMKPITLHGSIAGGIALLLALTGVYGIVSSSVSQRVREIGIRIALGAERREIIALIMRSGAAPVLTGIFIGLGLAVVSSLAMRAFLFGMNPLDPLTYTAVSLLMLAAAMGAIWIPARRAATVDPMSSLRCE